MAATGSSRLSNIAFNTYGSQLAVTSYRSNDVKVFDANTGKELLILKGHNNQNNGIDFNSDGTRIATSGRDSTARIWEAATGDLLFTLIGHTSTVTSVRFSSDDKLIVTSSRDGTIRVWDANTGRELHILGINGGAFNAEFSPDGNHIITGDYDGLKVFTLNIDELVEIALSRLTRNWILEECQKYLHMEQCPSEP